MWVINESGWLFEGVRRERGIWKGPPRRSQRQWWNWNMRLLEADGHEYVFSRIIVRSKSEIDIRITD